MNFFNQSRFSSILQTGISAIEMVLGTALTAAAFGLFVIPQNFASAGVTGLASIITDYIPLSLSQIVFIINMLFLILGFVFVGKSFTVKTIASSVLFPLMLQVFSRRELCCVDSPVISILIAGTLLGVGTGLLLHSGASSGGFAILGVLLQNKCEVPVAVTLNITDASIILLQAFRQSIAQTVYGIIVITLSAFLVGVITSTQSYIPAPKHPAASV